MNYNDIKLLVLDVDNVLTDGLYHILDNGVTMKSFYTRDFYAINELRKHDIKVLILTQSFGKCIQAKLDNLIDPWKEHITLAARVDDKYAFLDEYLKKIDLGWHQTAYMGDAENDLEAMQHAAITACPSDAIPEIQGESNFISYQPGGSGAVYDFIMEIIAKRGE